MFLPCFTGFNPHKWSFSTKAIIQNQLHDFQINSIHSCKKHCLHNCTSWGIAITVDPRIKFGLRKGDCFVEKMSCSPIFFAVTMNFFLTNLTYFVYWSSSPKNNKTLMLEVAKILKLTLVSGISLKSLTPASYQIFRWTKLGIIPKSERNPDVRD